MHRDEGERRPGGLEPEAGRLEPGAPPLDAEDWDDDQWIAWLHATDPDGEGDEVGPLEDDGEHVTRPGRIARSSGGALLGNAMVGVANALYGRPENEVVVVVDAPGEPEDEELSVHLDPEDPNKSVVVIRHHP